MQKLVKISAQQQLGKPDAFWKQFLWTYEVKHKQNVFGRNEQFGEERAQNFMKRINVKHSLCGRYQRLL